MSVVLSPRPPICLSGAATWGLRRTPSMRESRDRPTHRAERMPSPLKPQVLKPCPLLLWPVTHLQGQTSLPRRCGRAAGCAQARALSEEQADFIKLGPESVRHPCDPACLFLSNNLSQFYRTHTDTKAGRVRLAKARATTVSPASIPSQGPVPFPTAPTQGRGGPGSLCVADLLNLYLHRVNPAQTTASQSLTPKRGSQGSVRLYFLRGSEQRTNLAT